MEGNAFRVAKRGYILIISGRNDHRSLLIFFSPFFFARIRPGEEITRHYDNEDEGGLVSTAARGTPSLARCAHAVIFVVNANDLCLSVGKYRKTFRKIKELLRRNGNNITGLSNIFPAKKNFKGQCDVFTRCTKL